MVVLLRGIEFFAYHGVTEYERVVGQHYHVNLAVTVDAENPTDDRLRETLDYGAIGRAAIGAASTHKRQLVETVGRDIADALFELDGRVSEVEVEVLKLRPPVPFIADAAGVRLSFRRNG